MNRTRTTARVALALALLGAATATRAQHTGYDLERLSLDPSARGSLVLGSGETLPGGGARLSVAGGYERAPLVLTTPGLRGRGLFANDHRLATVVKDRFTLHLLGAMAITDRLELGLRVPLTLSQHGDRLAAQGLPPLHSTGEGPVSAMLRYGLTRQDTGSRLSSAVALEAIFPFSHTDDVDGDPRPAFAPRLELGHRYEHFLVAADVGALLRTRALSLPGGEKLRHELTAGVAAATVGAPLRYEVSLRGAANANGLGPHAELLGGARYVARHGELYALAGPGFFSAPGTPTFRAVIGLALGTAEPTPAVAPVAAAPRPADPCAPGQSHEPARCPALDDDGDGVPNGQDRCPTVAGLAQLQGCPAVDTDGDGIPDAQDRCPDRPGVADAQGCPPQRAEIKGDRIDLKEKVFFETGKAEIQQRSLHLLDEVARLLAANPQAGTIRIAGHTDARGAADRNRVLSRLRAEAVRDHLVARGVPVDRLEAAGYGPDQPAASNATAAGREANRRVEFSVLGLPKP